MIGGKIPNITRAPEPSDIVWENCENQFSLLRFIGIVVGAALVILIGCSIIIGLEAAKLTLTEESKGTKSTTTSLLSILTAVVLVAVNAILWIVLKKLLHYQYDHTKTSKIVSQMNIVFLAKWANIILVPIVVNYWINNKYFG